MFDFDVDFCGSAEIDPVITKIGGLQSSKSFCYVFRFESCSSFAIPTDQPCHTACPPFPRYLRTGTVKFRFLL